MPRRSQLLSGVLPRIVGYNGRVQRTVVLRAEQLRKSYDDDDDPAVDGVDLELLRGECFGLLGPNGAGKTTTVEILEGLLEASSGRVEVLGRTYEQHGDEIRQRIGLSLQLTHLPEKLTVTEILEVFRALFRTGRSIPETIALVALEEKASARYETLSGGQKQRVAVACALVSDPQILFLDEPTTGLDPQSRRMLWGVVERYKASGGTVLLTTHYMDEAERLCDRIGIMDHGKLIALGSPKELIDGIGAGHVVQITTQQDLPSGLDATLAALPSVFSCRLTGASAQFGVDNLHEGLGGILARLAQEGVALTDLSTRRASLEDVFVKLTGRHLRD
jgi:ABC-2 type transport system ATP-binding protein